MTRHGCIDPDERCPEFRGEMWRTFLVGSFFLGAVARGWAHDPGLSTAHAGFRADSVSIEVTFSTADLQALAPPAPPTPAWIRALFELRRGAEVLTATSTHVVPVEAGEYQFQLVFPRDRRTGEFSLRAVRLGDLPPGHRQYISVTDARGAQVAEKLLTASDAGVEISFAGAPTSASRVAPGVSSNAAGDAGSRGGGRWIYGWATAGLLVAAGLGWWWKR